MRRQLTTVVIAGSMLLACSATALAGATERPRVADATRGIAFADPATRPLADAVAAGKVARIRELAPHSNLAARGDQDVTLLEWAIWNRRPRALAALLEAGADPSLPGMDGETVVHMAAMIEDPTYLEILLAHGAPVDEIRRAMAGRRCSAPCCTGATRSARHWSPPERTSTTATVPVAACCTWQPMIRPPCCGCWSWAWIRRHATTPAPPSSARSSGPRSGC